MADKRKNQTGDYYAVNRRIALYMAAVITLAWAASFIVDVFDESYDPPASVHALMMIVAGSVFGEGLFQAVRKNGDKNGDR